MQPVVMLEASHTDWLKFFTQPADSLTFFTQPAGLTELFHATVCYVWSFAYRLTDWSFSQGRLTHWRFSHNWLFNWSFSCNRLCMKLCIQTDWLTEVFHRAGWLTDIFHTTGCLTEVFHATGCYVWSFAYRLTDWSFSQGRLPQWSFLHNRMFNWSFSCNCLLRMKLCIPADWLKFFVQPAGLSEVFHYRWLQFFMQ
jgi:hypothetical protein